MIQTIKQRLALAQVKETEYVHEPLFNLSAHVMEWKRKLAIKRMGKRYCFHPANKINPANKIKMADYAEQERQTFIRGVK